MSAFTVSSAGGDIEAQGGMCQVQTLGLEKASLGLQSGFWPSNLCLSSFYTACCCLSVSLPQSIDTMNSYLMPAGCQVLGWRAVRLTTKDAFQGRQWDEQEWY